jgi:shikimate dehydrogenase
MSGFIKGAILGFPVEHSLSPLLHRSAFQFLGIEGDYIRRALPADSLRAFFDNESGDFDYLSLTMPLKEEALRLPVEVDQLAERIQSANTLYRSGDQWRLTSTDGYGLIAALRNHGRHHFKNALVLGAGGTARAVVGALDGVSDAITVLGRTSTRRDALASSIQQSEFNYLRWIESPDFAQYDLVVNTTPAGAADLLADAVAIGSCGLLFDVIYKPWPTVLASRWADCGGEVINGLELLLYQGIAQLSLALNRELDEVGLATHLRPMLRSAAK